MKPFKHSFSTMGCPAHLHFYSNNSLKAKKMIHTVCKEMQRLDYKYSNYKPNSFINAINRSAGDSRGITVDEETATLLDYAQACYQQSNGLFDITCGVLRRAWNFDTKSPTLPKLSEINTLLEIVGWHKIIWEKPRLVLPLKGMSIDFGGVVKEYAADRAASLFLEQGFLHGLVDLGGDIAIFGPHQDGRPWSIGIQHPRIKSKEIGEFLVYQGGIASSGDYERHIEIDDKIYCHILNPLTGWPIEGISSTTVVTSHCLVAGSLSTISFLKGPVDGPTFLKELNLPCLCADTQGHILYSK